MPTVKSLSLSEFDFSEILESDFVSTIDTSAEAIFNDPNLDTAQPRNSIVEEGRPLNFDDGIFGSFLATDERFLDLDLNISPSSSLKYSDFADLTQDVQIPGSTLTNFGENILFFNPKSLTSSTLSNVFDFTSNAIDLKRLGINNHLQSSPQDDSSGSGEGSDEPNARACNPYAKPKHLRGMVLVTEEEIKQEEERRRNEERWKSERRKIYNRRNNCSKKRKRALEKRLTAKSARQAVTPLPSNSRSSQELEWSIPFVPQPHSYNSLHTFSN
ncbi:hypothetical protein BABINDRAFT_161653 [Babjeviella inositovora NRRL Y-12698]|uniref:Uncharacterized protein n=1 Tax=Babjeviella inositovora NRRL Y-12698 TaxID=984486 RepID=A0A1E3QQP5_9ASCO|nr:uncharacterized protein BABINDRAFT_161653 [Babjeviella inositovora NRRL Y-12698]ODQ80005.1 hypothetical protein BABINDRAFT_161653 [Babjeviella inositovora NRRL Y-12698]